MLRVVLQCDTLGLLRASCKENGSITLTTDAYIKWF
jgi:hypothetical protein